jgi:hypothetical protein
MACTGSLDEVAARLKHVLKERGGLHGRHWREDDSVDVRFEVQEYAPLRYGLAPYAIGTIKQTDTGCKTEFVIRFSRFVQFSMILLAVVAAAVPVAGLLGVIPIDPLLLLGGSVVVLCGLGVSHTLARLPRGNLYDLLAQYLKG